MGGNSGHALISLWIIGENRKHPDRDLLRGRFGGPGFIVNLDGEQLSAMR